MQKIRLQRTGNKNNPTYRIVVADKRNAAKGKFTEILGHYLPTREPVVFEFDKERTEHWLKMGAQPSDTMARLLASQGVKGLEKYIERYTKKKKRNAPEEEEAPAAPPAAAEEAPAEEVKEEEKPAEEPKEEEKKEESKEEEKPAEEPKEEEKEETKEEDDKKEADA